MQRRRYELQQEARNYGIEFHMLHTKEQLMNKLRDFHSAEKSILTQLPCQLARNVKDISSKELEYMLDSPQWIAEPKIDGCRAKHHLLRDGNRVDSRHRSVQTYAYNEKTGNFPHMEKHYAGELAGTVLDGEIVMPVRHIRMGKTQTEGSLTSTTAVFNSKPERARALQQCFGGAKYIVFDMLFYKGNDIRSLPLHSRRKLLFDVVSCIHQGGGPLSVPPYRLHIGLMVSDPQEKRALFGSEVEGIMLKDLEAPYSRKEGQRPKHWYKWKKVDTIDAFVTGFVPGEGEFSGLVGALLVSVRDKNETVEIASVQPGDLAYRRMISTADGALVDGLYYKVLEVRFQEVTKNNRLRHPVLVRWRPEKSMFDCTRRPKKK